MDPLYAVGAHAMLGEKYWALKDDTEHSITGDEKRVALNILAEMALGLQEPVYTDTDQVERIKFAIARTINVILQQGVEPVVLKSVANGNTKTTTTYRDRFVDPLARYIIEEVTGAKAVRFTARGRGE